MSSIGSVSNNKLNSTKMLLNVTIVFLISTWEFLLLLFPSVNLLRSCIKPEVLKFYNIYSDHQNVDYHSKNLCAKCKKDMFKGIDGNSITL